MDVNIKCPREGCGGKIYEDDFYVELKEKKVELACTNCARRWYKPLKQYRAFLAKKERQLIKR